tara:strand:+ start:279871 stop:280167 length:297 start_codon:yes stop_codon:yes gene_type:complete
MMNRSSENFNFYIQKKENYLELKKLNENIIAEYKINLPLDSELYKLKRKVEYDESMINGLGPNKDFAEYYWWFLIGLSLTLVVVSWLGNKRKTTNNNG